MKSYPTIIIHGTEQSEVFLHDEHGNIVLDENERPIRGWPPKNLDMKPLIGKALPRLLGSLVFRCDVGLTKLARHAVESFLAEFRHDERGRHRRNMQVVRIHRMNGRDKAPTSMADVPEATRDYAYRQVPLHSLAASGEGRLYYFAYDTFGNHIDAIDELYQLIQDVLKKHNAGKVNLLPISLGCTVMNALAEYYPQVYSQLNNVVYIVPAFNGSMIVGDIFCKRLTVYNKKHRHELLLKYTGKQLSAAIGLLPEWLVYKGIGAMLDAIVGNLLNRATMIWALLPKEDYPEAKKLWLGDPALHEIARQTDRYYQAQMNAVKNIKAMQQQGVRLYNINEYNIPLPRLVNSRATHNADGVIDLFSTSMGAASGYVDTPLPNSYLEKADPKYISPDGIVDASTGALPDTTFYLKDVHHHKTSKNEALGPLVARLVAAQEPETVFTLEQEGYRQFM